MTTPKKPGPEPRAAQNRSALRDSSHHCDLAVGGHHLDRVDRLGRPAPAPAVPAHPALQQEAAEPDRRAVPAGEEPPPGGEERVEVDAAADRRAGRDDAGVVVVAHPGEGGQVDQERVVAERPGGPAVPARADGDPQALGRRQPHPGRHVGHVGGAEHGGGPGRRPPPVEDPADRRVGEPVASPRRSSCPLNECVIGPPSTEPTSSMRLPSGISDVGHPHPRLGRLARVPDGDRAVGDHPVVGRVEVGDVKAHVVEAVDRVGRRRVGLGHPRATRRPARAAPRRCRRRRARTRRAARCGGTSKR